MNHLLSFEACSHPPNRLLLPQSLPLSTILPTAAEGLRGKSDRAVFLLQNFHSLPVAFRIKSKLLTVPSRSVTMSQLSSHGWPATWTFPGIPCWSQALECPAP